MTDHSRHIPGGLLIMFEGIDGVGKTTQVQLAREKLSTAGWPVVLSRTPGGTPIGEALRVVMMDRIPRSPMTALHISIAIQEALIEAIAKERENGSIILLDRSPLSMAAYQIYGSGADDTIGWQYVDDGMKRLKSELVIIYECEPSKALDRARLNSTETDYYEDKPLGYFKRVAKGYQVSSQRYESVVIDANQPVEQVRAETFKHIDLLLAEKTN